MRTRESEHLGGRRDERQEQTKKTMGVSTLAPPGNAPGTFTSRSCWHGCKISFLQRRHDGFYSIRTGFFLCWLESTFSLHHSKTYFRLILRHVCLHIWIIEAGVCGVLWIIKMAALRWRSVCFLLLVAETKTNKSCCCCGFHYPSVSILLLTDK